MALTNDNNPRHQNLASPINQPINHPQSHSLDRLEKAESLHWDMVRARVLPDHTSALIGIASDETKTFQLLQSHAEHVDVSVPPPPVTLQAWMARYQDDVDVVREKQESAHGNDDWQSRKRPVPSTPGTPFYSRSRPSDVSMDMSMSSSFSFSSPTSRTG